MDHPNLSRGIRICKIWLTLTKISYEIENTANLPHKIGFIKTSVHKKSHQLESLPSRLLLADSDPTLVYMQLYCITKPEQAIPHSFSSLSMCVDNTNNFSKTDLPTITQDACDRVKTEPATEVVKYHFSPEVLQLCHRPPGKKSVYPLTFKSSWLMLHSYNCSAFFQKGIYWTSEVTTYWKTRLLCATHPPAEHWSTVLWKNSPIRNFTNLRIHFLIFFHTTSISLTQNTIV